MSTRRADTEQLIELLNEEREISDRPNPVELKIDPSEGAEIEFKDVTFSYDQKIPVLKGVSFKVGRGQSVALVGPSGGGKSTITKLIYRFYDVSSGSISINGHDIRDLTQRSLRASIGLVPQESVLFNSSARMNIAYGGINRLDLDGRGSERITMDEVIEAAKAAAIHDKIMSFPDVRSSLADIPDTSAVLTLSCTSTPPAAIRDHRRYVCHRLHALTTSHCRTNSPLSSLLQASAVSA